MRIKRMERKLFNPLQKIRSQRLKIRKLHVNLYVIETNRIYANKISKKKNKFMNYLMSLKGDESGTQKILLNRNGRIFSDKKYYSELNNLAYVKVSTKSSQK